MIGRWRPLGIWGEPPIHANQDHDLQGSQDEVRVTLPIRVRDVPTLNHADDLVSRNGTDGQNEHQQRDLKDGAEFSHRRTGDEYGIGLEIRADSEQVLVSFNAPR